MSLPNPIGLTTAAKTISALLPAFFAGTIFGFNYILIPPILKHSEEHVLAKQWLEAYQFGARYVRPLVQLTTIANASLVYLAASSVTRAGEHLGSWSLQSFVRKPALSGYLAAALSLPVLMAYTLGVMEPGVNGALKAKVKKLEGREVQLKRDEVPVGEERDTATVASKERAEAESLRSLIMEWKRCNDYRMALAIAGAVVSCYTSLKHSITSAS